MSSLLRTLDELRVWRRAAGRVAFVPTMGNLHEGHLALVRQARAAGDRVLVSIFVNPLQFGPGEDLERYPRTLEADRQALAGLADAVFVPDVADMYPQPQSVYVELPPLANELCGAARPGHFRGMATVVLKLLNMVQPDVAVFGKKDYQQLHLVRRMVAELNLPVEIVAGETVRASDGLALSSRNQYLDEAQRAEAVRLSQVLKRIARALEGGAEGGAMLEQAARAELEAHGWRVDYVSIRRQSDLAPCAARDVDRVVLAAARLGQTRLLDNVEVCRS